MFIVEQNPESNKFFLKEIRGKVSKEEVRYLQIESSKLYNEEIRKLLTKYTRDHNLEELCQHVQLPAEFIKQYETQLRPYWPIILRKSFVSEEIIKLFFDHLVPSNLIFIISHQELSIDFLQNVSKFFDSLHWSVICISQKLTEEFLFEHYDKIDWKRAIANIVLEKKILFKVCRDYRFYNSTEFWKSVIKIQSLSNRFLEEFADIIDWEDALKCGKISRDNPVLLRFKEALNIK